MSRLLSGSDSNSENYLPRAERPYGPGPLLFLHNHQARGRYAGRIEALCRNAERRSAGLVFPDWRALRHRDYTFPAVWHGPSGFRLGFNSAQQLSADYQRRQKLLGHGPGIRHEREYPEADILARSAEDIRRKRHRSPEPAGSDHG